MNLVLLLSFAFFSLPYSSHGFIHSSDQRTHLLHRSLNASSSTSLQSKAFDRKQFLDVGLGLVFSVPFQPANGAESNRPESLDIDSFLRTGKYSNIFKTKFIIIIKLRNLLTLVRIYLYLWRTRGISNGCIITSWKVKTSHGYFSQVCMFSIISWESLELIILILSYAIIKEMEQMFWETQELEMSWLKLC